MKKNERLQALQVLTTLFEDNIPLSQLMQSAANLTPLSKELCFGVCRQYYRLEALADELVNKRPKTIDVWLCMLMGLYQLHYLRIPDYAVVKETVALVVQLKKTWAKGLVNAVLRTFCREQASLLAKIRDTPQFQYNHPSWFVTRLQDAWPDHWQAILQANDTHAPMTLRVNCKKTSVDDYLSRLQEITMLAHKGDFSTSALTLSAACDVHDLPGFGSGDISVQDQAAQLAVLLLDLKPGQRVLDACCAPGGKTCHMLETQPNLSLVGLDIDKKRLIRVQDNLNRLHLEATLVEGNAATPGQWWDGVPFNRILLDAPCSATGVIRRHPDIKLLRTPEDVKAITDIQHRLLRSMWPLLEPGGLMVYSTCSIMPEENELQVAQFITETADCNYSQSENPWGHSTGHGWQILPGEHEMDGFFYSVLIKKSI